MKKKIIIIIVACLIVLGGVLGFCLLKKDKISGIAKDEIVSTVTIDINPSIQINLGKDNKVISVVALNDDAKEMIDDELKGLSLEDVIANLTEKAEEKGYVEDGRLVILVHSDNNDNELAVKQLFEDACGPKNIHAEIIQIENITKEDKELAEKYNITPAKAAYINSISKENENISFESLIEKPIREIRDTKESGNYCNEGYSLEGDFCVKEVKRVDALEGSTCPKDTFEKNGKCFKEEEPIDTGKLGCNDGFKLEGDKCVGVKKIDATADFKCENGNLIKRSEAKYRNYRDSGNKEEMVCEDDSKAVEPHLACLDKPHIMLDDGVCADGPKPTINGGCPNGDYQKGDGCYTRDPDNANSDYKCPDGSYYKKNEISLCPDTFKYTKATGNYSCPSDYKLNGTKCEKDITENAQSIMGCNEGYTFKEDRICVDFNTPIEKEKGYYCEEENSRLEDNKCVILDIVEANHN